MKTKAAELDWVLRISVPDKSNSLPASARWYICSASPSLPWPVYRFPRFWTVVRVDVWSGPSAFSYPASACWEPIAAALTRGQKWTRVGGVDWSSGRRWWTAGEGR
jgi:hypothetical protein